MSLEELRLTAAQLGLEDEEMVRMRCSDLDSWVQSNRKRVSKPPRSSGRNTIGINKIPTTEQFHSPPPPADNSDDCMETTLKKLLGYQELIGTWKEGLHLEQREHLSGIEQKIMAEYKAESGKKLAAVAEEIEKLVSTLSDSQGRKEKLYDLVQKSNNIRSSPDLQILYGQVIKLKIYILLLEELLSMARIPRGSTPRAAFEHLSSQNSDQK